MAGSWRRGWKRSLKELERSVMVSVKTDWRVEGKQKGSPNLRRARLNTPVAARAVTSWRPLYSDLKFQPVIRVLCFI
jgi:hypothetical protein